MEEEERAETRSITHANLVARADCMAKIVHVKLVEALRVMKVQEKDAASRKKQNSIDDFFTAKLIFYSC